MGTHTRSGPASRRKSSPGTASAAAHAPRFPSFADLVHAKKWWKVSVAALNHRMRKLDLITEWHYRSMCIEIGRLGRSIEPESLPREQSQVLTKVLAAMREEDIGSSEMAAALNVYESDLDAVLAGLVVTDLDGGGEKVDRPRPNLRLVGESFDQRASAAFRAISERSKGLSFSARAGPPF